MKTPEDPIVEEVRRIRYERAAKFGFDMDAVAEDARTREKSSGRELLMPPRKQKGKRRPPGDGAKPK